jgi:PAS domain S-box-containing protein
MLNLESRFLYSIKDPLIIMDPNHRILFINENGAAIYNSTKEEATDKICYEVFKQTKEHCKNCPVEEVMKSRKSYLTEQSEIMPNGKKVYGEVRSYPVFNENNEIIAVSTIAIDITGKKMKQKKYTSFLSDKIIENTPGNDGVETYSDIRFSLSNREIEVLRLIAEGFSNPEIADMLSISLNTVKTHITNIFNKLGINDRTLAAIKALKMGLI